MIQPKDQVAREISQTIAMLPRLNFGNAARRKPASRHFQSMANFLPKGRMSAIHSPEIRTMHKEKLIRLTRSILSQPTAPFHEDGVKAEIRAQLARLRPCHRAGRPFGNLIARYSRGHIRSRYAFSVHMDHPAGCEKPDARPGEMTFLGGVKKEYLDKGTVQSFGEFGMWHCRRSM